LNSLAVLGFLDPIQDVEPVIHSSLCLGVWYSQPNMSSLQPLISF